MIFMDESIKKILYEKLMSSLNQSSEIEKLVACFEKADFDSLHTGIILGRLYNSFFYQHRRILKRNPSDEEFNEFIDFIKSNLKLFSK
tara:strand:+ start:796 stop:1059 length:264 start_codon:yes stop_codon:yes gene_type:complete